MNFWRRWSRKKWEQQLDDELRFHVERQTAENIATGLPPDEARRQAVLQLGAAEGVKGNIAASSAAASGSKLWGGRSLRPSHAAQESRLHCRRYPHACARHRRQHRHLQCGGRRLVGPAALLASRIAWLWCGRAIRAFHTCGFHTLISGIGSAMRAHSSKWRRSRGNGYDLTSPGTPEHLDGRAISSGFFSTLGVKLTLGREFSPRKISTAERPSSSSAIVCGEIAFAGSPEALGKSVTLDGVDYTIVGVPPPGFRFEGDADVYTPLGQGDPVVLNVRASHGILSIARLKPGVSMSQAQAEMSTIQNGLDQLYPDANRDLGIHIEPLKQVIVGKRRRNASAAVGSRGVGLADRLRKRRQSLACALGGAHARICRFARRSERIARAWCGSCLRKAYFSRSPAPGLGLLLAMLGVRSVLAAVPGDLPRSENIGVNAPVLLFTLGVSIAVGILFGLAPALKNWNADLQASLKEGGRGLTRARHRAQSSLVIVQMALTLVLLVGAGLLFRTIRHLWDVNPGFDTQHVITFKVGVSHSLTKTACEHSNCLSAVDRAHSEDSRRAGGGFHRRCSAERSGRHHALLDWLAEARFAPGSAAASVVY